MFSPEKCLWLCVNVFFNADMPGSFKETVLAVSTIISLAAAVIVCNSLLHQGVKETDWLWVSSEIRSSPSESIEGNTAGG